MKKTIMFIILFLFSLKLIIYGYNHINLINQINSVAYIERDKVYEDIISRINKDFQESIKSKDFKVIKQQNIDNSLVILYTYKLNRLNKECLGCATYELEKNGKYKLKESLNANKLNIEETFMLNTSTSNYLIHFGYINDNDTNLFEVKIGNSKSIKEYKRNDFFMEFYDMSKGGVTITPVK